MNRPYFNIYINIKDRIKTITVLCNNAIPRSKVY